MMLRLWRRPAEGLVAPQSDEGVSVLRSAGGRAFTTVADQGLSSVSNFAVSVVVARLAGPAGLGVFALAYASWLLLASVHRSLVTDPMAIEGDARDPGNKHGIRCGLAAELLLGTAASVGFGLVGVVIVLCGDHRFGVAMLAVAPWLPALVVQDYWRWVGFMTARPAKALANDIVFDVAEALAFLLVFFSSARSDGIILAAWGVSALAGAIYGLFQFDILTGLRRPASGDGGRLSLDQHLADGLSLLRARWGIGRWIAGNTVLNWGASQGYLFVAGGVLGSAGLGGLKAAQQTVTGPSMVLIQAAGSIGLPEASKAYDERGWRGLLRVARLVTAIGVASVGSMTVVMAIAGRWLLSKVYGAPFGHFQETAVLLGIAQTISILGVGSLLVMKVTRHTHYLMYTVGATLVASIGGVALLGAAYGVNGAATAEICAAAISLVGERWFQHRAHLSIRRTEAPDGHDELVPAAVVPAAEVVSS